MTVFSYSIWHDCPYTGRSIGAYILFYQGLPIDHCTHVPGPFAQSSSYSEYNVLYTAGMALAHFRMINNEFPKKDSYVVP